MGNCQHIALRLRFSLKLEAPVYSSLPHLKLVPLLHCHFRQQPMLKAGGSNAESRPVLCWCVVNLFQVIKLWVLTLFFSPSNTMHCCLSHLGPLAYQVSGPAASSPSLIMFSFQDQGSQGLVSNVFCLP